MQRLLSGRLCQSARRLLATESSGNGNISDRIKSLVDRDDVVLFMKGTPQQPMCGFSQLSSKLLAAYEVKFQSYDVLQDPDLREGIKVYSDWPTIPQLYVKQEFIGGADILRQMYVDGELDALFQDNGIPFVPIKSDD